MLQHKKNIKDICKDGQKTTTTSGTTSLSYNRVTFCHQAVNVRDVYAAVTMCYQLVPAPALSHIHL